MKTKQQGIQEVFLNKYINPQSIGEGEFGQVFKCEKKNKEFVAIKVVELKMVTNDCIPYLRNEICLLSSSQNNNIIELIEYVQTKDRLYLVLECCFIDMQKMINKYFQKVLPDDLVIIILRQLVNGLHYLHQNKIIHRDIKLSNIGVKLSQVDENKLDKNKDLSVFNNAQYKLLDLGSAKQLNDEDLTNTYAGTRVNMAPEILLKQPYSISADMYSLGVCMFQLTTGELPYSFFLDSLDMIKEEKAKFNLIKNESLRIIIQKMLKYDPNERLSWSELYQNKFFENKRSQTCTILDLQLQNNQIIYSTIVEKNMQIKEEKKYIDSQNNEQIIQEKGNLHYNSQMNQQQRTKIKYWIQLRNIHILLNKLSSNLIILINSINYIAHDLMCQSLDSEFNNYINYFCDLNQQTYNYLKFDLNNNLKEYKKFQDYITLKNSLESEEKLLNIQENRQSQNSFLSDLFCFAKKQLKLLKSLDLRVLPFGSEEFQQQTTSNNIIIYNQILKIMYDSNSKIVDNNQQEFKLIQSQIYRILIDLARVRVMFVEDWKGGDEKINELRLQDFENEPDLLSKYLTQILQFYQLRYDQ